MSIHIVRKNGFKYTFYDDETYNLYISGEAYFDEGQTLRKRKGRGNICNRVKVEPDDRPIVVQKQPIVVQRPPEYHPVRDAVREGLADILSEVIHMGVDWFFNDEMPYLWNEKIKPGFKQRKENKKNGRKLIIDQVIEERAKQESTTTQIVSKPKSESKANNMMTGDEIRDEQRKAVLHYIGLLESLTKLHNAGVIDKNSVIEQLTTPAAIEQFNQALSSNPNLLEMTKSNDISKLLGRDLFQGGELVPIKVKEIEILATNNEQEDI